MIYLVNNVLSILTRVLPIIPMNNALIGPVMDMKNCRQIALMLARFIATAGSKNLCIVFQELVVGFIYTYFLNKAFIFF